jgi:hypothetical protein
LTSKAAEPSGRLLARIWVKITIVRRNLFLEKRLLRFATNDICLLQKSVIGNAVKQFSTGYQNIRIEGPFWRFSTVAG